MCGEPVIGVQLVNSAVMSCLDQAKPDRKRGNIVADANVSLFARARNICCEMFLNFFRKILRPQQMFPRFHSKEAKHLF